MSGPCSHRPMGGRVPVPSSFSPCSSLRSQKNSSQAADIFAAVTRVLRQAPVDLWGSELLAGEDEGALGWITINYVLGLLVKVPRAAPGRGWLSRAGSTWLVLELTPHLSVLSSPSLGSGSSLRRGRWWVPWTWVGPPPRSPSCPEFPFWTRAPRPPSASTVWSTESTPTATSASGGTRCSSGSWRGWCRWAGGGQGLGQAGAPVSPAGAQGPFHHPAEQPGPPNPSPMLSQWLPGHTVPGLCVRVALCARHSAPRPPPEPHCGRDREPRGLRLSHPEPLQLLQLRGPRQLRLQWGLPAARAGPVLREYHTALL